MNLPPLFTTAPPARMMNAPSGKLSFRRRVNCGKPKEKNIMGDKSPKANQKKSGQKKSKVTTATAKKKAAVTAKQAAGKKK
jgi:hypothetical protein